MTRNGKNDEQKTPGALSALIKQQARTLGADLVGIADLKLFDGVDSQPADLLSNYRYAVSMAVKLPNAIFEQLQDRPTPIYAQVYANANALLDQIALRLSSFIEGQGGTALPIPASQPLDMTEFTSHLSAKAVANAAGLGWQGKSLLIITPEYGPRVRLVTVLTDLFLEPGQPVENRCGTCRCCTDACVAQAIRNVSTTFHYADRDEALDFQKCADKLTNEFMKLPLVEKPVCGICIKVCPWGRKQRRDGN